MTLKVSILQTAMQLPRLPTRLGFLATLAGLATLAALAARKGEASNTHLPTRFTCKLSRGSVVLTGVPKGAIVSRINVHG